MRDFKKGGTVMVAKIIPLLFLIVSFNIHASGAERIAAWNSHSGDSSSTTSTATERSVTQPRRSSTKVTQRFASPSPRVRDRSPTVAAILDSAYQAEQRELDPDALPPVTESAYQEASSNCEPRSAAFLSGVSLNETPSGGQLEAVLASVDFYSFSSSSSSPKSNTPPSDEFDARKKRSSLPLSFNTARGSSAQPSSNQLLNASGGGIDIKVSRAGILKLKSPPGDIPLIVSGTRFMQNGFKIFNQLQSSIELTNDPNASQRLLDEVFLAVLYLLAANNCYNFKVEEIQTCATKALKHFKALAQLVCESADTTPIRRKKRVKILIDLFKSHTTVTQTRDLYNYDLLEPEERQDLQQHYVVYLQKLLNNIGTSHEEIQKTQDSIALAPPKIVADLILLLGDRVATLKKRLTSLKIAIYPLCYLLRKIISNAQFRAYQPLEEIWAQCLEVIIDQGNKITPRLLAQMEAGIASLDAWKAELESPFEVTGWRMKLGQMLIEQRELLDKQQAQKKE